MDKELLLDDIIKEKANSEILSLPADLDMKIKETINSLPEKSRSTNRIVKRITAACIMFIIGTFSIGATFPAFAFNVPVVNSVFQYMSEKNLVYTDYVQYSSDLNMSQTSEGVTIMINSIVYDGIDLSIGYTVVSDTDFSSKISPHLLSGEMKVNGKTVGFGGGGSGTFKDTHTFIGMDEIHMSNDYLPKELKSSILGGDVNIPDEFIMSLKINRLSDDIKGNWNFKFKVSTEKTKDKIKVVKPNITLSPFNKELTVNEVIFTPINTVLRISGKDASQTPGDNVRFIAFDDKGRPLSNKSSSESSKYNSFYSEYILRNIYEDTKSVTFIPQTYTKEYLSKRNSVPGTISVDTLEVPLNFTEPTVISQGKLGEYKITQVELSGDKTLIHYECTGLLQVISPYYLWLSTGEERNHDFSFSPENVKETGVGTNKFIAELPPLSKDKKYKLISTDYEKMYEIKEDAKFTVDIPQD